MNKELIEACYNVVFPHCRKNKEAVLALIELRQAALGLAESRDQLIERMARVITEAAAVRPAKMSAELRQFKREFLHVLEGGKKN